MIDAIWGALYSYSHAVLGSHIHDFAFNIHRKAMLYRIVFHFDGIGGMAKDKSAFTINIGKFYILNIRPWGRVSITLKKRFGGLTPSWIFIRRGLSYKRDCHLTDRWFQVGERQSCDPHWYGVVYLYIDRTGSCRQDCWQMSLIEARRHSGTYIKGANIAIIAEETHFQAWSNKVLRPGSLSQTLSLLHSYTLLCGWTWDQVRNLH